jgi:nucleoside-diphosphate-sugar epimerase
MATEAFVTGGSGFVGGRLIRRLLADGYTVRALARSEQAAATVRAAGAMPVRGELSDEASIAAGARGCELAFHAAAAVMQWGRRSEFAAANVDGTRAALAGCRSAGVRRFVHVGTEAALLAGKPLVNVNEDAPLRPDSKAYYASTKAQAELFVRRANTESFETITIRPRLVWGPGDTTILPGLRAAVDAGRFSWVAGGQHLTSTTHVDNTVEGLMLGALKGRPGAAYFVTDGEPVVFREFITELAATGGVQLPDRNAPAPVAAFTATAAEAVWRRLHLKSAPPLTRLAYWLTALETTIDISRARQELGYVPVRTISDGMRELRELAR